MCSRLTLLARNKEINQRMFPTTQCWQGRKVERSSNSGRIFPPRTAPGHRDWPLSSSTQPHISWLRSLFKSVHVPRTHFWDGKLAHLPTQLVRKLAEGAFIGAHHVHWIGWHHLVTILTPAQIKSMLLSVCLHILFLYVIPFGHHPAVLPVILINFADSFK